jgi:hypothetical protein
LGFEIIEYLFIIHCHFARHFARGHPKPPNSTQQQPN